MLNMLQMIRLDYLSCILTVLATVLIGKKLWQGWVVAGINSAVVCVIGMRTAQFGFVPANLLCIALYTSNVFNWRFRSQPSSEANDVSAKP
jgi:membrane-bound ClpP family serine protease